MRERLGRGARLAYTGGVNNLQTMGVDSTMLQRIIGHTIGAIVVYLWLIIFAHDPAQSNTYAIAAIVGALCSFFWPIVIAFFLARRVKARRQNEIDEAVAKSMAEQNKQ